MSFDAGAGYYPALHVPVQHLDEAAKQPVMEAGPEDHYRSNVVAVEKKESTVRRALFYLTLGNETDAK